MSIDEHQLSGVTVIGENDIVCGRGGAALKHSGNLAYRKIVNINKTLYATCLKAEKLRISKSIVAAIREVNGRFLEREDGKISTTLDECNPDGSPVRWCDIGDRRAIEKTSQALREGQPKLLKKLKQAGQFDDVGANTNGYAMPIGAQPPMQEEMPPLTQINIPHEGQNNYQQYDQTTQGYNQYASQQQGYSGTSPSYLKQDSFQMMIEESLNLDHKQGVGGGNDPFAGHTSIAQPPPNNNFASSNPSYGDSWNADPTPLPYQFQTNITMGKDESKQLMHCLSMSSNSNGINNSTGGSNEGAMKQRQSVTFKRGASMLSLGGLSEFGNWETQSLDSAMDIADRETDLQMLGKEELLDFDWEATGVQEGFQGTAMPGSSGGMDGHNQHRGSILRRSSRYRRQSKSNFSTAVLTENANPGMLFTSTFDAKPGGVNAGTDISGLLGERRKSAVAFEIKGQQRRQSRLSNANMFGAIGEISQMFRRDCGSTMSIQTADIKDLIDMDDDE